MKKFTLGIVLFVIGIIGVLFLIYGSLEFPHSYLSSNYETYVGLIGFLKGNGLEFLFYVFVLFTISGLTISIMCSFTKIFDK